MFELCNAMGFTSTQVERAYAKHPGTGEAANIARIEFILTGQVGGQCGI